MADLQRLLFANDPGQTPNFPPAQIHSETSCEAADAMKPNAETLRRKVLDFIASRGAQGATDDEIQEALGMGGSTERPRRVELVAGKLIAPSGETRKTRSGRAAAVWVVVGGAK